MQKSMNDNSEDSTSNLVFGDELQVSGESNFAPTDSAPLDQTDKDAIIVETDNTSFIESTSSSLPKKRLNTSNHQGEMTTPPPMTNSAASSDNKPGRTPPREDAVKGDRMGRKSYIKLIAWTLILLLLVVAIACIIGIPYLKTTADPSEISSNHSSDNTTVLSSSPMKSESATPSIHPTTTTTTTTIPNGIPSLGPTTDKPSDVPSTKPSTFPSLLASESPTIDSESPSQTPTSSPTFENATTIFYAIGDVPYSSQEKVELEARIWNLPSDGDFLIHLGDFRSAQDPTIRCSFKDYMDIRRILLQSKIPVFIIPGDNEWNDCPNSIQGMSYWVETFSSFDRNWKHSFQVERHAVWPENFHFVHKGTLYFGLNLVGGAIDNTTLYSTQLSLQWDWVKSKIDQHVRNDSGANRIVIFGHAFPLGKHDAFFDPLQQYVLENTLLFDRRDIPILYLNGDNHYYDFEPSYRDLPNFQRLQVDFGTINPPLKVMVSPPVASNTLHANETFSHDRMLLLET